MKNCEQKGKKAIKARLFCVCVVKNKSKQHTTQQQNNNNSSHKNLGLNYNRKKSNKKPDFLKNLVLWSVRLFWDDDVD